MVDWCEHNLGFEKKRWRLKELHGYAGYGIYWTLCELSGSMEDNRFDQGDLPSIALMMGLELARLETIVELCLEIGMFEKDEIGIYCPNVVLSSQRIEERKKANVEKVRRSREKKKLSVSNNLRLEGREGVDLDGVTDCNGYNLLPLCNVLSSNVISSNLIREGVQGEEPDPGQHDHPHAPNTPPKTPEPPQMPQVERSTPPPSHPGGLKAIMGKAMEVGGNPAKSEDDPNAIFLPLTPEHEADQRHMGAGRRPLRKYPCIWITPPEFERALEIMDEKLGTGRYQAIFQRVAAKLEGLPISEQRKKSAFNWLTGWALTEELEQQGQALKTREIASRAGGRR